MSSTLRLRVKSIYPVQVGVVTSRWRLDIEKGQSEGVRNDIILYVSCSAVLSPKLIHFIRLCDLRVHLRDVSEILHDLQFNMSPVLFSATFDLWVALSVEQPILSYAIAFLCAQLLYLTIVSSVHITIQYYSVYFYYQVSDVGVLTAFIA